ncbi:hypothetical protein BDC45DRAFT_533002 [Circinella umbellata]|nr:hypothetical protein BDC45DRAFT_533002 [Circinella umbellata]
MSYIEQSSQNASRYRWSWQTDISHTSPLLFLWRNRIVGIGIGIFFTFIIFMLFQFHIEEITEGIMSWLIKVINKHPRASFAQLMNQLIYHPFGLTLSPSSEAIIIGRLDSIQGEMASISQAISRLQETVNLLVERQGQQGVASGGQDRADSNDEAGELPLDFFCQPCSSRGKVRNPTKSNVEGAVLAFVNGNIEEQQKKLAGIEKHIDTAIRRMKILVPSNMVPES